jgi:hypothetical protein
MKLLMDYVREAERRTTSTDNYYLYLLLKSKGRKVTYVGEEV